MELKDQTWWKLFIIKAKKSRYMNDHINFIIINDINNYQPNLQKIMDKKTGRNKLVCKILGIRPKTNGPLFMKVLLILSQNWFNYLKHVSVN